MLESTRSLTYLVRGSNDGIITRATHKNNLAHTKVTVKKTKTKFVFNTHRYKEAESREEKDKTITQPRKK